MSQQKLLAHRLSVFSKFRIQSHEIMTNQIGPDDRNVSSWSETPNGLWLLESHGNDHDLHLPQGMAHSIACLDLPGFWTSGQRQRS